MRGCRAGRGFGSARRGPGGAAGRGLAVIAVLAVLAAGACEPLRPVEPVAPVWVSASPLEWAQRREPANPVIPFDGNPLETAAQYVPAPILLPSGEIWVYVKGDVTGNISAYRSGDGGKSFAFQGVALERGAAGTWDSEYVHEPVAVFERETGTIHVWYKGSDSRGAFNRWSWGYATAPASAPGTLTKDPGNPILGGREVEASLGVTGVHDLAISEVVKVAGDVHFFGYFGSDAGYQMFHARGAGWNQPVPTAVILRPEAPYDLVQCPALLRAPGAGPFHMIYTVGYDADYEVGKERGLRVAVSADLVTWEPIAGMLLEPDPGASWEEKRVYCASVLKNGEDGFLEPALVDGKVQLYYSASSNEHRDQTGLLYLDPFSRR